MGNNANSCVNQCMQKCQLPIEAKQLMPPTQNPQSNIAIQRQELQMEAIQAEILKDDQAVSKQYRGLLKKIVRQNRPTSTFRQSTPIIDQQMIMLGDTPIMTHVVSEVMEVPYSVVRLTTTQKLNLVLNGYGRELTNKYQRYENKLKKWKLHKKGYYINYLGDRLYSLFTENKYFEGQLAEIGEQFLPIGQGILISQEGIYIGQFEKGKAKGKGTFKGVNPISTYSGIWEQGKMIQGIIEDDQFMFEGILKDSLANGNGSLYFKRSRQKYLGQFENGYIHDKNGYLENDKYIYKGGFQNGYKQGEGCLTEKERHGNAKTKLYLPAEIFNGNWRQDKFEGKSKYVTLKKGFNNV